MKTHKSDSELEELFQEGQKAGFDDYPNGKNRFGRATDPHKHAGWISGFERAREWYGDRQTGNEGAQSE